MSSIILALKDSENRIASSILLKFDRREGFHRPPLKYDAQITVCPVGFFAPAKIPSLGLYFRVVP